MRWATLACSARQAFSGELAAVKRLRVALDRGGMLVAQRSVARLGYDLGIPAEKIRWEMNGIINKDRPSARDILLYSPEAV
eukprot:9947249-Ditylum_brightwellii.AAC.1